MSKVRIFHLARDLNVESKFLIEVLQASGIDVRSPSSTVDAEAEQIARDIITGKKPMPAPSAKESPKTAAAAPAPGAIPAPGGKRLVQLAKPKSAEAGAAAETAPETPAVAQQVESEPTPAIAAEAAPETSIEIEKAKEPEPETPPLKDEEPPEVGQSPSPAPGAIPPPGPKRPGTIPPPSAAKPMNLPSPSTQTRSVNKRLQEIKERRSAAARPLFALSQAPPRIEPVKRRTDGPVQKPVMKLTPEALRGGRVPLPDSVRAAVGAPELPLVVDDGAARRGGPPGKEEREKRRPLKEGRRRNLRPGMDDDDDQVGRRASGRQRAGRRQVAQQLLQRGRLTIELPVTVRSFSETTGVRYAELARRLMSLGFDATINASLTEEQVELLGVELGLDLEIKRPKDAEIQLLEQFTAIEDDPADLAPRPPIVTFMGHVDHGKTSLMDRIRSANVAAGESGGITQHVGAYQVAVNEREKITFLDTPGHEAFTAMRARGANLTDIVVLVVAADDGVMPQTEEAIAHAKAADVSIVVAMNKIDLPQAKTDRLQQQLSRFNLISEAWGGDTLMVGTSATTGQGIDELLEAISIVAELKELKANPKRPASGTCIEASLSEGRGVQCTLLVRNGTLRRGDIILCGPAFGRVRAMYNDRNEPIQEAGPSTPVVLSGLDAVPNAGEDFLVVDDLAKAREIADLRKERARVESRAARQHVTLEKFYDTLQEKKVRELLLILKADVRGSIEAIRKEISDFVHDEVRVRIIHDGVGGITEGDVLLADASDAIIVGFHVAPDERASALAAEKGVEIRRYEIIYQVSDDIKKALEGMLKPESREVQLGRAVVQEIYPISRVGTIAGCRVVSGTIERSARCRIIRDGAVIGTYPIQSLKRVKDDAKEVREGLECGIKLADFDDIKRGDLLEAFKIEEIKRTL